MKRSPIKIGLEVLGYLAAGAVVNVVVAAGCALWGPVWTNCDIRYRDIQRFAERWTPQDWIENPIDSKSSRWPKWDVEVTEVRALGVSFVEVSGREDHPPGISVRRDPVTVMIVRSGWPWNCLEAASQPEPIKWNIPTSPREFGCALSVNQKDLVTPRVVDDRYPLIDLRSVPSGLIPLSPVWPALIANTIVWALILAMLVHGPRWVRGEVRLRRGLCRSCGYPIGVADRCTECGRELPRWVVRARNAVPR